MTHALTPAELDALFASGATLILPRSHAARVLRSRFARTEASSIAETRMPLAWAEWTRSLWSDVLLAGVDDRALLNRLQEEQLWADIISRHPAGRELAPGAIRDLARLARSGFQFAASHRVLDRLRIESASPDARTFAAWTTLFVEHCTRERLLAPAMLEHTLALHLETGRLDLSSPPHLIGFEKKTPAQAHFLEHLRARAVPVNEYVLRVDKHSEEARVASMLPDSETQLEAAVQFVRKHLRSGTESTRVVVVTVGPEDHSHELERLLRQMLAPELEPVGTDLSSTPWFFASRPPLASTAVVRDALDLLRWTVHPLPLERLGQLLLSPYIGFAEPFEARARFDLHGLRTTPILRGALKLADFTALVGSRRTSSQTDSAVFPELRRLSHVVSQSRLESSSRPPGEWADLIRRWLEIAGWPGHRELSAAEFEATEAWQGVLDLVASLQYASVKYSFKEMLDLVAAEASVAPCPSPIDADQPIQVLTLADTEGLNFDRVLLLDATDRNLPASEPPHPLLPLQLQRALGRNDPRHSFDASRQQLQNLAERSGQLLALACPSSENEGAQLTPLVPELGFVIVEPQTLLPIQKATVPVDTEPLPDPPLPPLTSPSVRGGAEVLRLQAACGFRSFATLRLSAQEAPARALGLDARETGTILHSAMETFWQGVQDQASLRALSDPERRSRVQEAVDSALARLRPVTQGAEPWADRYLHILRRRFTNLLTNWLSRELTRASFTVLAREEKKDLALGPITLSLRPDRIDQVEGGLAFVDYKTSYDLAAAHWLGERPDAPQLAAYALTVDPEELRGIAFAQVRPGESNSKWISLTDANGVFPAKGNRQVDLHEQVEIWRAELTGLAEAFANGDTRVNPKSYPKTCQYCGQRALCRLDPASLLDQSEQDEDEADSEDAPIG